MGDPARSGQCPALFPGGGSEEIAGAKHYGMYTEVTYIHSKHHGDVQAFKSWFKNNTGVNLEIDGDLPSIDVHLHEEEVPEEPGVLSLSLECDEVLLTAAGADPVKLDTGLAPFAFTTRDGNTTTFSAFGTKNTDCIKSEIKMLTKNNPFLKFADEESEDED